MTRFLFPLALLLCSTIASFADAAEGHPNVILIITDDQGYGDISAHGNPLLKTPAMDRLHADSIRLIDFHVDPTCAPTRGALMTGKYSASVGVWLTFGSRHHLYRHEITMADVFKQNGYRTGIFGKWHLGDNYPFRPMDRGFDESLIHGGGVVGETPDHWANNYYDDIYSRNGQPERVSGYCTDVWFNAATKFIEQNQDRPFFAYISTNAPHGPLHVPEKYREPYADHPDHDEFYGMVANIDENLDRLRHRLDELDLSRETILVFMTDNGTNGGAVMAPHNRNDWTASGYNAGMRGRKTSRYEGGHRVPLFIHWPSGGLTGGKDLDGVTAHIDLLPTLIELCELKNDLGAKFDGISLASALHTLAPANPERTVIVHDQSRFNQPIGEGELIKGKDFAVMKGSWRLVGEELFDLSNDPAQRHDIAEQHPNVVQELSSDYEAWWQRISAHDDAHSPFVINPAKQSVVTISSQNLLGAKVAFNQRHVRAGEGGDGWTTIEVEAPGTYDIALRRWPRESYLTIGAPPLPFPLDPKTHFLREYPVKTFSSGEARLKIGTSINQTRSYVGSDQEIVFTVELHRGLHRIQTWLDAGAGQTIAAYYTYISPSKQPEGEPTQPLNPS
ncbi:MAG: arylsulfatase [Synoicihabitans sp.]